MNYTQLYTMRKKAHIFSFIPNMIKGRHAFYVKHPKITKGLKWGAAGLSIPGGIKAGEWVYDTGKWMSSGIAENDKAKEDIKQQQKKDDQTNNQTLYTIGGGILGGPIGYGISSALTQNPSLRILGTLAGIAIGATGTNLAYSYYKDNQKKKNKA